MMHDREIIGLYWRRDEDAIRATEEKYGPRCTSIACSILERREDAEECVSDTWLHAWNAMPPQWPEFLGAFLGKITRNLSFNRWRSITAQKRGGGELMLVLHELEECVKGERSAEEELEQRELIHCIEEFLDTLSRRERELFLDRYWYVRPVEEMARERNMTKNHVSVILSRLRAKLRRQLEERGIEL